MRILGIDPGSKTGVAVFDDGELIELRTVTTSGIDDLIRITMPDRVIFEDSRLQSHVWNRGVSARAVSRIARSVGQVDAFCSAIARVCGTAGIPYHGISPRQKGRKLSANDFRSVTGWNGRSNQHERDAAMCAWRFRMARSD